MKIKYLITLFAILTISCSVQQNPKIEIKGDLKKWHTVTLDIPGPETSEWAKENPFLDYRLEVLFKNGDIEYTVPGFFAADGNAAETSAEEGNIWRVRFLPDKVGTWTYTISFRKAKDIAISERADTGQPVQKDGTTGTFEITDTDKSGNDFRGKGRLVNGGHGYLAFQESGELWIKNGADSPENFLGYADFDQTLRYSLKSGAREGEADPKENLHRYQPHIADWKEGDPSWQGGKGKGIIGALNYLASVGVNSQYMLTLNILGDGKDVWPYTDHNERYRFDCSKLDQWEIVFSHMDKLGMMIHFVLQETENECLLDNGNTDVQRMLYLRELVARFAHHPAVTWNIGEENGPASWSPVGQTEQQKKDMASYLKKINPYSNLVVVHTHADDEKQDEYLTPLLAYPNLDGPSMQIGNTSKVFERIKKWVDESKKAGKRWVVNLDEIGQHWKGVLPDAIDPAHDTVRADCLWATLMAGGAGVEWYFGYAYPNNDLNLEDYRSRELWWKQTSIATSFIKSLPLPEMKNIASPARIEGSYCLSKGTEMYVIYLPSTVQPVTVILPGNGDYTAKWFNPREGGEISIGIPEKIQAGRKNTGLSPKQKDGKDWVLILEKL